MVIPDEEQAKRKLSQIGYYRLSGFWYPCRKGKRDEEDKYLKNPKCKLPIREDKFQEGTDFNLITDLYLFDNFQYFLRMISEGVELLLWQYRWLDRSHHACEKILPPKHSALITFQPYSTR